MNKATFAATLQRMRPRVEIEASFQTTCEECGGEIIPGDLITKVDEVWIHSGCVES